MKRKPDEDEEKPSPKKPRTTVSTKGMPAKETPKRRPTAQKLANRSAKRAKPDTEATESTADRRRSSRAAGRKSYADRDSGEDEEEMMEGVAKWEYSDGHIEPNVGDAEMDNRDDEKAASDHDDSFSTLQSEATEAEHMDERVG